MEKKRNKKEKPIKFGKKTKIGLALGGGGGLGIAHIGALKAFEELGINFDYVAGTSAGSIVGALYAFGKTSDQMLEIAKTINPKKIRNSKLIIRPSSTRGIEQILLDAFGKDLVFSELKKPLTVVSVNLLNGKEVHITSGSVAHAVAGSAAVPGIFRPVEYEDMHLVDGGIRNNLPADVVRDMGAKIVIAVELNYSRGFGTTEMGMLGVLKGALGIMMSAGVESKLPFADIVIQPDMREFAKTNLKHFEDRYMLGYNAVMASKKEILNILKAKPAKSKMKIVRQLECEEHTN